jgi:NAD(P)H dehydrogenase (quinone)
MKIGITGAGGQLGMALVRQALARVPASDIVAITRNPGALERFSQQGVQVRSGDFSQPSGLPDAFGGVERLVIIPTSDLQPGARRQQHIAAIQAAANGGVQHVMYISTVGGRPDPQNELFDSHFATDQALIGSGLAWTLLRMSCYTETLLDGFKRAIAAGVYTAVPGAPAAYVVREDIAAAAAGILATPGHEGITYHATGPVSISQAEIAEIAGEIAGKPVRFEPMTEAQQRANLSAVGLPPNLVNTFAGFQAALRAGAFDLVTGDVGRLTGKPAESPVAFFARTLGAAAGSGRG